MREVLGEKFVELLNQEGIPAYIAYSQIHETPFYKDFLTATMVHHRINEDYFGPTEPSGLHDSG